MTVAGSVILIFFAIVQRMAMRITYGARGPQPDDKVYFVLNVLNWLLPVGALAPLVGSMPWFLGLVLLVLLLAAVDEGLRASRQLQQQTTVSLLRLAAERNLPLSGAIFRHATDQGGSIGRATRRLLDDLEEGAALSQAIQRHKRAVPRETVAYAAVGEAVSDSPQALANAARRVPVGLNSAYRLMSDRLAYLLVLSLFMTVIVAHMMTNVVPQFEFMFAEFALDPPAATQILMAISTTAADHGVIIFLLLLYVWLATLLAGGLYLLGIPIHRPVTDRLLSGRHRAVVLRCLALAAERGQPFEPAVDVLAATYPSRHWRRRLRKAWKRQQAGQIWSDALRSGRLIRGATHGLVRAGERVGNLAWVLRAAADREESREAVRYSAAVQAVFAATILLFAASVGFVCYSLFVPLVQLIYGMTLTT